MSYPPLAVLGAKQSVGVFFISFTSFPENKSLRNEAATHRRGGWPVAAVRIQNGFNALFKHYSTIRFLCGLHSNNIQEKLACQGENRWNEALFDNDVIAQG
jgi:hypothetical protein